MEDVKIRDPETDTPDTEPSEDQSLQSVSIAKLADALSKAQGQIKGALKDSDNPFFKSKYADLAAVWEACREALSNNGLAVVQSPTGGGVGGVMVVTTLLHSSGEWMRGCLTIKPTKEDPQALGSAITYARRYALAAMVGVAPEDDDGEAAMGRKADKAKTRATVQRGVSPSDEKVKEIVGAINMADEAGQLQAIWTEAQKHMKAMTEKQVAEVTAAKDARKDQLAGEFAA